MPSKQVLNRQVQVLEDALIKLTKVHNNIINDINKKVRCEECRNVMIEHTKQESRKFNFISSSLLSVFNHVDYSASPYNLFKK